MAKQAVRAVAIAGFLGAVVLAGPSSAAIVGPSLGSALPRGESDAIAKVRCCRWGPRGWYDTWRNCHYCWWGPYCWWSPDPSHPVACRWRR
jgi:hypothetical protein